MDNTYDVLKQESELFIKRKITFDEWILMIFHRHYDDVDYFYIDCDLTSSFLRDLGVAFSFSRIFKKRFDYDSKKRII